MDKDIAQRTSVVTAAVRAVRIEQCRAALTAIPDECAFSCGSSSCVCGLPEPALNQAILSSRDPTLLLGVADMAWEFEGPDGTAVKLVGKYQGREFHSSDEKRSSRGREGHCQAMPVEWAFGREGQHPAYGGGL